MMRVIPPGAEPRTERVVLQCPADFSTTTDMVCGAKK